MLQRRIGTTDGMRWALAVALGSVLVSGCGSKGGSAPQETFDPLPAGGSGVAYIPCAEVGEVAVRIELPDSARYPEGAPVVVHAATFFAGEKTFHRVFDTPRIGVIALSYLRPGTVDPATGHRSTGEQDFGGPLHLAALRDVIRFAGGSLADLDGRTIQDWCGLAPEVGNVGLFASSHAGIVATNVMAHHGDRLSMLRYFVGRENPTRDEMYPLELGYFDAVRNQIYNPFYDASQYTRTTVEIDYERVGWIENEIHPLGRPDFLDDQGRPLGLLHPEIVPRMWERRYYSRGLTQALHENGALDTLDWPADLATPRQTQEAWPFRTTVHNYGAIGVALPELRVLLTFATKDHVQAAPDKPHIRQAYDGFRKTAGLTWVRLNPDRAYALALDPSYGAQMPDNPANEEPGTWMEAESWGYPGVTAQTKYDLPVAGVAEMADRTRAGEWAYDLDAPLWEWP
ncbi:MAG: hypothetical protein GF330_05680 [Candidatus Eisenbacteria bacterium]|nr:hypothetical protein [Candidatus Eisenbacteria bacterium]